LKGRRVSTDLIVQEPAAGRGMALLITNKGECKVIYKTGDYSFSLRYMESPIEAIKRKRGCE
jgi:hypothetical protein